MEGYLTKRGSFMTTWKSRWFELFNSHLTYYKNQTKKEEKGVYCLTPETVVESCADKEGQHFMLRVLSPD